MQTTTLTIEGMHCAGCAATIDHVLRRQPGVWETEISLAHASARVLIDPGRTSVATLADEVRRAGYGVSQADS
jgi:copper chaperone CopZ